MVKMVSIINQLATSLNRRDEIPNQELAKKIADKKDNKAVGELIDNLANKNKGIQSDCIKVLYEVAEINPTLLVQYIKVFADLLKNKSNRLQWGAMTTLDAIAAAYPDKIYSYLPAILDAADAGSVITKDHAVSILIKLSAKKQYSENALTLLLDQLKRCATNQLPMYAENALPVIPANFKADFSKLLLSRLKETDRESKKKRIEKVVKKLAAK